MALSRRQLMDKAYAEAERIHEEVEKSRRIIDKLCEGQPSSFRVNAQAEFTRAVKGERERKPKTEATPIRQVPAATA